MVNIETLTNWKHSTSACGRLHCYIDTVFQYPIFSEGSLCIVEQVLLSGEAFTISFHSEIQMRDIRSHRMLMFFLSIAVLFGETTFNARVFNINTGSTYWSWSGITKLPWGKYIRKKSKMPHFCKSSEQLFSPVYLSITSYLVISMVFCVVYLPFLNISDLQVLKDRCLTWIGTCCVLDMCSPSSKF